MKTGLILTGGISALLIVLLVIGFWRPTTWEAYAEGVLDADAESIRAVVADPSRWSTWTGWPEGGSTAGPPSGVGASRSWDDPGYGEGTFTITEVDPGAVGYSVEVEGGAIRITGRITFEPDSAGTRVTWSEQGAFGRNPLLKLASRGIEEAQSDLLRASLDTLGAVVSGRTEPAGAG